MSDDITDQQMMEGIIKYFKTVSSELKKIKAAHSHHFQVWPYADTISAGVSLYNKPFPAASSTYPFSICWPDSHPRQMVGASTSNTNGTTNTNLDQSELTAGPGERSDSDGSKVYHQEEEESHC